MNTLPAVRQTDDYPALMGLAKELVTTGFLPVAIKTPAQAVAIILTGRELGLPPMQSLRSICIIQGKPELSADLQLSIFHRDGGRSKWLVLTNTEAKVLLKHPNGDQHTESFTIQDAAKAGLASGQNWVKYPKAMLRSRAITAGLKSIGFEPLTGAYAPGEIGGPEVDTAPGDEINGPAWICEKCGQQNCSWAAECGRCQTVKAESIPVATADSDREPQPKTPKAPITMATANTRAAALDRLGCYEEGVPRNTLHSYLVALGWLENEKMVEQWPLRFVPISKDEIEKLRVGMAEFSQTAQATMPYQPHGLDVELLATPVKPIAPPAVPAPVPAAPSPELPAPELPPPAPTWRDFVMPFGAKTKGKTLGSLSSDEVLNYCDNFTVREFVEDAKGVKQNYAPAIVESQRALRAALDEAQKEIATTNQPKG